MRRAGVVVAGAVAAVVVIVGALLVTERSTLAFTPGVVSAAPIVVIASGDEVCQRPIDVPVGGSFDRLTLHVGTFRHPGSALDVRARNYRSGRVVAAGTLSAGYPDIGQAPVHRIALDRTVSTRRISVCVRNRGPRRVALYGNADAAARTSSLYRGRHRLKVDLSVDFERAS